MSNLEVDEDTYYVYITEPYTRHPEEYDHWEERNCCSPNRTKTLYNSTVSVTVGSVSFEMETDELFGLILPTGFSLDGSTLKLNGSHTVTVQQSSTDAIALPRCSQVDVTYGAGYTRQTAYFEGMKTCIKIYPPSGPGGQPTIVTCGTFLDFCSESLETLYAQKHLFYDVPVSPTTFACGTVTPNPCADTENPACGG